MPIRTGAQKRKLRLCGKPNAFEFLIKLYDARKGCYEGACVGRNIVLCTTIPRNRKVGDFLKIFHILNLIVY